jgi:hypothetical protein
MKLNSILEHFDDEDDGDDGAGDAAILKAEFEEAVDDLELLAKIESKRFDLDLFVRVNNGVGVATIECESALDQGLRAKYDIELPKLEFSQTNRILKNEPYTITMWHKAPRRLSTSRYRDLKTAHAEYVKLIKYQLEKRTEP